MSERSLEGRLFHHAAAVSTFNCETRTLDERVVCTAPTIRFVLPVYRGNALQVVTCCREGLGARHDECIMSVLIGMSDYM